MKPQTFKSGMTILFRCFPSLSKTTTEELITWGQLLSDIPDVDFTGGIVRLCREEKQLYPGTNIVSLILSKVEDYKGRVDTGEEAWGEVTKKIVSVGSHQIPEWSSPVIKKAVDAFGWVTLCLSPLDNLSTVRSQFMRIYEAMKRRESDTLINADIDRRLGLSGLKTIVEGNDEKNKRVSELQS